jgi:hypothetical protein
MCGAFSLLNEVNLLVQSDEGDEMVDLTSPDYSAGNEVSKALVLL